MRPCRQLIAAAKAVAALNLACVALSAAARAEAPVLTFTGEVESDYIYRGITLSAHRPSLTGSIELQQDWFYVSTEISSVKLPAAPVAEVVLSAGVRPKIGYDNIEIDLGIHRYLYPFATPVDATGSGAYTEAAALLKATFEPWIFESEIAYAPNYANTGAYAFHTSAKVTRTLLIPPWLPVEEWGISAEIGQLQFGTVSSALGGYHLANYIHWGLGLEFKRTPFTLELNFTDTTLSREDCFVQTGDPFASPGGTMTDVNPLGLRSNWCGPAFVAKLSLEFSTEKKR